MNPVLNQFDIRQNKKGARFHLDILLSERNLPISFKRFYLEKTVQDSKIDGKPVKSEFKQCFFYLMDTVFSFFYKTIAINNSTFTILHVRVKTACSLDLSSKFFSF